MILPFPYGIIATLIFITIIVILVIKRPRRSTSQGYDSKDYDREDIKIVSEKKSNDELKNILKERLTKGEISKEEF